MPTPGAPSEERGQAEAIARSIALMTGLRTPIVTVICGEGGSGGALAIAVGDVVLALENAIYSVISPEGCASILWRTPDRARDAAVAMRLTAREQQALGVIDTVISEPGEGAHADLPETARRLREAIVAELESLIARDLTELVEARYARYRAMGAFTTTELPVRERRERRRVVDRLRALLDSGRPVLAVGSGARLTPGIGDEPDPSPERPSSKRPSPERPSPERPSPERMSATPRRPACSTRLPISPPTRVGPGVMRNRLRPSRSGTR